MNIFTSLDKISNYQVAPLAAALGAFDGLHRGHAALISRAVTYARTHGMRSAVFTFSNHARNFIAGHAVVKNIVSAEEKIALIAALGVDELYSLPFDEHFHVMPPEIFIQDVLLRRLNAAYIGCGFNFHFGAHAAGGMETLSDAAQRYGFELDVMPPFKQAGTLVSSSLIRTLISEGKVDCCPEYLGRYYAVSGMTIHGNGLGKELGFATANIALDDVMVTPPYGVYVSRTSMDGAEYQSVTNIGNRPTVGDDRKLAETHIFGVSGELYGRELRVELLKMLRSERKFSGLPELAAQVARDKEDSLAYFVSNNVTQDFFGKQ